MSSDNKSRNFKVLVLGKIGGSVSRLLKMPGGTLRIETWRFHKGWEEGGASLDEFVPGPSCIPVSAAVAARFGIPAEELVVDGPA